MNSYADKDRTAVVFMADGMEMCECLLTVDILRRAKVKVITASVMKRREVTASHQVMMYADTMAEDVNYEEADIIILPGGRVGTANLAASSIVAAQCRAFADNDDKYVAAICAAPSVLSELGILDGRNATCHPDFAEKVIKGSSFYGKDSEGEDAHGLADGQLTPDSIAVPDSAPLVHLTHESVTVDGNIITGQGLGAAMDFALCLAEILAGKETADRIAASICLKRQQF